MHSQFPASVSQRGVFLFSLGAHIPVSHWFIIISAKCFSITVGKGKEMDYQTYRRFSERAVQLSQVPSSPCCAEQTGLWTTFYNKKARATTRSAFVGSSVHWAANGRTSKMEGSTTSSFIGSCLSVLFIYRPFVSPSTDKYRKKVSTSTTRATTVAQTVI